MIRCYNYLGGVERSLEQMECEGEKRDLQIWYILRAAHLAEPDHGSHSAAGEATQEYMRERCA